MPAFLIQTSPTQPKSQPLTLVKRQCHSETRAGVHVKSRAKRLANSFPVPEMGGFAGSQARQTVGGVLLVRPRGGGACERQPSLLSAGLFPWCAHPWAIFPDAELLAWFSLLVFLVAPPAGGDEACSRGAGGEEPLCIARVASGLSVCPSVRPIHCHIGICSQA